MPMEASRVAGVTFVFVRNARINGRAAVRQTCQLHTVLRTHSRTAFTRRLDSLIIIDSCATISTQLDPFLTLVQPISGHLALWPSHFSSLGHFSTAPTLAANDGVHTAKESNRTANETCLKYQRLSEIRPDLCIALRVPPALLQSQMPCPDNRYRPRASSRNSGQAPTQIAS